MRTPTASLFAIVTFLAGIVTAVPTPTTDGVARRSFASGGVTCYYQCPTINGLLFTDGAAGTPFGGSDSSVYTCNYLDLSGVQETVVYCIYASGSGRLATSAAQGPNQSTDVDLCALQATDYVCGTQPEDSAYFKRDFHSTVPIRQRTPAEEAIHRRQYKPAVAAVRRQKREKGKVEQLA